ncbi:hypothetical protein LCGC14_0552120 [marine sediment metagenome]|uniref:Uncharacterized protein n=1 Tax=marine sediment metagenome TaxID=412755 RepID=A0A0F9RUI3_9ZZZZ
MTRNEQIREFREHLGVALKAASYDGEIINLSVLIGGAEQIHIDDHHGKVARKSAVLPAERFSVDL